MTKSITNTFNNLEQMISAKSNTAKLSETYNSGMDKMQDFKKVFDKEINKNKANNTTFTLENLKRNHAKKENATIAGGIKEAFKRVEKDAKTESSLNLTLAKDIEEIISQLQEAVESTAEIIENGSKKSKEESLASIEEILNILNSEALKDLNPEFIEVLKQKISEAGFGTDESLDNLKDFINENFDMITQALGQKFDSNTDGNNKTILEALLAYVNNTEPKTTENNVSFDKKIEIEQLLKTSSADSESSLVLDMQELTSDEIVEFSKNIADEVITAKSNDLNNVNNDLDSYFEDEMVEDLKIESISAETDSSANDSFMQNQSPEEYALKAMINEEIEPFELKIESTSNVSNIQQVQTKSSEINPSRILEQITRHLEGLQNNSKVSIVLNPESLGKVDIQLFSTKDGLMAQFTVTTQEAKDLLMKDLDSLKNSLLSQGVGVDNISVKVADSQKSEYQEDWTEQENSENNKREQEESNKREKEKGLFEKMFSEVTENENGSV